MLGAKIVLRFTKISYSLLLVVNAAGSILPQNASSGEVQYKDLEDMSVTCPFLDNCSVQRSPSKDNLRQYNCLCGKNCATVDSCCVDSPYRTSRRGNKDNLKCHHLYGSQLEHVFMIDRCKRDFKGDSDVKNLCSEHAELANDPFLAVAVTSQKSGFTYKNYFCYLCNEDNECDDPVFWDIVLHGEGNVSAPNYIPILKYSVENRSWTAELNSPTGYETSKITFSLDVPDSIKDIVHMCRPNVISSCPTSWTDENIRLKCMLYTAIIIVGEYQYKNPHCAICNSVNTSDYFCMESANAIRSSAYEFYVPIPIFIPGYKGLCDPNSIYDRFSRTCRPAGCKARADIPASPVTYEELEELEATCDVFDNCKKHRPSENLLNPVTCLCEKECVKLNACCVDSSHRLLNTSSNRSQRHILQCGTVYGSNTHILMKHRCNNSWRGDEFVRELCSGDPEVNNDPILAIPVTSQKTNITYRNYFCYLCNEEDNTEAPIFWSGALKGSNGEIIDESLSAINYYQTIESWMIGNKTSVTFQIVVPKAAASLVHNCQPKVVSECSHRWNDEITRKKCAEYMAVVHGRNGRKTAMYRNPHCALCNFIDVLAISCLQDLVIGRRPTITGGSLSDNIFISMFLPNDNRCDGDMLYDRRAKKCRHGKCLSRQYVKQKGRCVPKRSLEK